MQRLFDFYAGWREPYSTSGLYRAYEKERPRKKWTFWQEARLCTVLSLLVWLLAHMLGLTNSFAQETFIQSTLLLGVGYFGTLAGIRLIL